MYRFTKPLLGAAAISLAGLTASAQTVCNADTMAGIWLTGSDNEFCRINLRDNGRFTGNCRAIVYIDDLDDEVEVTIPVRGRINVQENCQIFGPARRILPDEEVRVILRGYAWGSDVPMAFHAVSITQGANYGATFIRQIEFEDD